MEMETVLPKKYGYVVIVVVLYCMLNVWMGIQVEKARKKYKVYYLTLYVVKSENKDAKLFNCVQRGHQNSLEMMPMFFVLMVLGGIGHPCVCVALGLFYMLTCYFYFTGYATRDPQNRLSIGHLLAAAALATLLSVSAASNFAFYKLSLRWPTSICNTGAECKSPIPPIFTIHGLWPQLANDHEVPPYDKNTNKCNNNPTSPDDILVKLQPIERDLRQMWPSIRYNEDDTTFWEIEWKRHGMCSEYPQNPYAYFNAALTLAQQYNPLDVMGIKPADKTLYQVKKILDNVKAKVKAYPQISCNMLPKVGTLQLREIRFCFEKGNPPTKLKDCPNQVGDKCTSVTDKIRLPPPPAIGISCRPNITCEFISS